MLDNKSPYRSVSAIVAHPDDELSCAGTLARFAELGARVNLICAAIPDLDRQGNEMGKISERIGEFEECLSALGINVKQHFLSIDEEDFTWSQKWVRACEARLQDFNPDLVITQRRNDTQQTHAHLSNLVGTLARKNRWSLWEMDQPIPGGWESDGPKPNMFVNISSVITKKILAIDAYKSQLTRYPGMKDAILNRDRYYGWLMNMECEGDIQYAEGFRIRKGIWL